MTCVKVVLVTRTLVQLGEAPLLVYVVLLHFGVSAFLVLVFGALHAVALAFVSLRLSVVLLRMQDPRRDSCRS